MKIVKNYKAFIHNIKKNLSLLKILKIRNMLPKFLLADTIEEPDKTFVVHTQKPRFIVECDTDGFDTNQQIHWIDRPPKENTDKEEIIDNARGFFELQMDIIDGMFDNMQNDKD